MRTHRVATPRPLVGCAGWSIPRGVAEDFPADGTHLVRYAGRFPVVEINSTFYKPHRTTTFARWAESVPESFSFAVKVPKEITHRLRLVDCDEPLSRFLEETAALGHRRGPLLVQLPPSLGFDETVAGRFLAQLRQRTEGPIVCEPRHPSWFATAAARLLHDAKVARAAADPAPVAAAAEPGGWPGLVYRRLHGSPVMYRSAYDEAALERVAQAMLSEVERGVPSWCIFDNTASGAAAANALALMERLAGP